MTAPSPVTVRETDRRLELIRRRFRVRLAMLQAERKAKEYADELKAVEGRLRKMDGSGERQMASLTAERVEQITKACLYADNEWPGAVTRDNAPEGAVFAEGILHTFAFNPNKLSEHRAEISELLAELPAEFQVSGGGGWSFLNACMDRHGNQWTGLHQTMERLFCLGIATDQARWQLPREMWDLLPGGMPYVSVGEMKAAT